MLLNLLLPYLLSCGEAAEKEKIAEIDEEVFLEKAEALLRRAEILNAILFEEDGLPVLESGYKQGNYAEVSKIKLLANGFKTLDDIKAEAKAVFSDDTLSLVNKLVFNPEKSEGSTVTLARYIVYQNSADESDPQNGKILKYTGDADVWSDKVTFDYGTIAFVKAVENRDGKIAATLTLDVSVTKGEKTQVRTALDFTFLYEDGGYKLDTLPCVVYDARYSEQR